MGTVVTVPVSFGILPPLEFHYRCTPASIEAPVLGD